MHLCTVQSVMIALFLAGCADQSSVKSVELLDERTGATMGALREPIAFIETGLYDLLATSPQQASVSTWGPQFRILYLGPVEWDRSGEYTYGLWVQVAPGVGGHRLDDIRARGAVTLKLDDGPVTLSTIDLPKEARSPYSPMLPWGKTTYFAIDVAVLKRMAASKKTVLTFRAADLTMVEFIPFQEPNTALTRFLHERGITVD